MTDSISESVNNKGVCRTAPATPGLLKSEYTLSVLQSVDMPAFISYLTQRIDKVH